MIQTTFNSAPALLINFRPDWAGEVSAIFRKKSVRDVGLSAHEVRWSMAATIKTTLRYATLLNPTEASDMRAALAAWQNQTILCPFWPAESRAAQYASASVQGSLRVWYEPDWSAWSINTSTAPTHPSPTGDCLTCPLMVGTFVEFPLAQVASGRDDEFARFNVIENGDAGYALAPKSVSLELGTPVQGYSTPVMNVPFSWGRNTSELDVKIQRGEVGYGRTSADVFYPQTPRTRTKLNFTLLTTDEVAYLLGLFADRQGSVKPFWCPPPHSVNPANRVFGRFFGDELTITWKKPALVTSEVAETAFEFISLPTELTLPSGQVYGTTIGEQLPPWFGYAVTCGSQSWYFTSYESVVIGPGGFTYEPKQMSHGTITEEINLEVNECVLTVHAWPGCPFAMLIQQLTADPIMVTIYEGDVGAPSAAVAIFTGKAQAPDSEGQKMKIQLTGPGADLSVQGPRGQLQETCLAVLGDSRCQKDISAMKTTQTLLAISLGVGEFNVAGSGWAEGYFKNGYAERTVGTHKQRIMIADSFTISGSGRLGILFGSVVTPAPVGAEAGWVLAPGCDGYFTTCKAKFSNGINFRGAPHLPKTNPSIIPVQNSQASSGKK